MPAVAPPTADALTLTFALSHPRQERRTTASTIIEKGLIENYRLGTPLFTGERTGDASAAAQVGFEAKVYGQPGLHKRCYYELRSRFGLSAQMAVRAIAKAVEVFKRDKTRCPVFRSDGAMTYDERILGWKGVDHVSLWTLQGRELIAMSYGEYQAQCFDRRKGQVELVSRDGRFYLYATVDVPEGTPVEVHDWLGADLGVVNLAATSDGDTFTGEAIERTRQRYHRRRQALQQAATGRKRRGKRPKNLRRALRRTKRRESCFRRDVNHGISKILVQRAKGSGRGLAFEELTHIRTRTRFRRGQRARMSGWALRQLRQFSAYKAKRAGVPTQALDPAHTSRTCRSCGHCATGNRPTQALFRCLQCGHTEPADLNAAQMIRARALVKRIQGAGIVADDSAA
jgi:putative transposase